MSNQNTKQINTIFAEEVREGLTQFPKTLSSKYFYDEIGDQLFQEIMAMPSYYLTNAEFAILMEHKEQITAHFSSKEEAFDLFELGAGDGKKTKILLRYLLKEGYKFKYRPIDISQNALALLEANLLEELPELVVESVQGTYFDTLKEIGEATDKKKVILFLGSNIGNLLHPNAISFLTQLKDSMSAHDLLFMGMDQKKNPQMVLDAYNDQEGITAAFNKNILKRINRELGGDFNLDNFLHWEVYDPETGTAKSYLVAKKEQKVTIEALQLELHFNPWETIHTEISHKYDDQTVAWLAGASGLEIVTSFEDQDQLFKDYLLKKK